MNTTVLLTESIIQREALTAFAALTRHAENPKALESVFRAVVSYEASDDLFTLAQVFGKRTSSVTFAPETLMWSLDKFRAEVLDPAARMLLESA